MPPATFSECACSWHLRFCPAPDDDSGGFPQLAAPAGGGSISDDDPPPPRPFDTLPSPVVTDDRNDELAPDTLNPKSLDIQESSTHLTTLESPPLLIVVALGDAKMESNRAARTRSRNTKGEGGWRRPGRNWAGALAVDLF